MLEIVFLIPFLTGAAAFFLSARIGRCLLVVTGAVHLVLSVMVWAGSLAPNFPDYFAVTPEGLLSLLVISLLFFLISIYTIAYLKASDIHAENIFTGSMLLFLSTMTMVTLSDHIMVMWIAIEATTLASAPLIYTHRSAASLEATWKYVLICSVGIAMALLGSVLVTVAMDVGKVDAPISFSAMTEVAKQMDPMWLKAGFVFILVGYGTKMGLAPMHTWLPDAHSEAPSPASALLSGVLLNCAYLGIFKTNKVMHAAGLADFSGPILIVFGLVSIMAAATFILKQTEYKRMLAYSSIENMGIIAFGTGIGGLGAYGAMICLIHHSLIKSSLFLTSGNILLGFGSRLIDPDRQPGRSHAQNLRCLFRRFCRHFRISAVWHLYRRTADYHRCLSNRQHCGCRFIPPQPVRDFCRICQQYHENFLRGLGYHHPDQRGRQPGLAPIRAAVNLPGALFLDAGHLVPDHNPCGERHRWRILMTMNFKTISNGNAIPIDSIPLLSFEDFSTQAVEIVSGGGKVVQFFGFQADNTVRLMAILRTDELLVAACDAPEAYPALTTRCEPFHMFEREIAEQYGIRPEGHPWLKMVRYHANSRGVEDVFGNDYSEDIPGRYDYYSVAGDEIHEVAVGPVHAGVIEPGHFRFNCIGERVLNLEIQLGYQHRGVEDLLLSADARRLPFIAENMPVTPRSATACAMPRPWRPFPAYQTDAGAKIIRTIGLELERIANHVGDLGALSGDVAFLPPANYCGRMRGDFLNMSLLLCGNRFGKGLVRPGGVRFPMDDDNRRDLTARISELKPQVKHTIDLLFSTSSVRSRFEGCGTVSRADAETLGLVGPAGRACGNPYDVRRCFPTEQYDKLDIPENAEPTGDVYARARVRADEVMQSIAIIESLLPEPGGNRDHGRAEPAALAPDSPGGHLNEAWRGELSHCILTDAAGGIRRYKIKDPLIPQLEWPVHVIERYGYLRFPLNNKSYNLSYCGFDL
jgi:Ni,Fe-hydrogenase III large subunit/NADH:ubiquinone oxidoreductase subunit 2 (subunit N)